MAKLLKTALTLLIGGTLGFSLAWWIAERPTRYTFRSKKEIVFVNRDGNAVGGIPSGTILLSSLPLGSPDLGWSGYVEVWLGTGSEAEEFVEPTKAPWSGSSDHWITGRSRDDHVRQPPAVP